MKISVAMATYNGERFIREQLESLIVQSYLPDELVVCDDGSTDETVEIIDAFSKQAPFPVKLYLNEKNLGFSENFLKAARLCQGEWIAFCDQDDIWLPNKLSDVNDAIARDTGAVLFLQNAYICDENLTHQRQLFPNRLRPGFYPPHSHYGFWVWLGFLQTVDARILKLHHDWPFPMNYQPGHKSMSHDSWTCMIANSIGGYCVLENAAALYRRHGDTVTGSYSRRSISHKIKTVVSTGDNYYEYLSQAARETASYMRKMAERTDRTVARDLLRSAHSFETMSQIQRNRAAMFERRSFGEKLGSFIQIARAGGYLGPPEIALGWKSAVKDSLQVLGLLPRRDPS